MRTQDLYQKVTNDIIKELEAGTIPWVQPWKNNSRHVGIMPVNVATGRSYSGINIPILWHSQRMQGFPEPAWMTFQQALHLGAHVRKGEKGTTVVFTKPLIFKGEDNEEHRKGSMLKSFTAFNIAQIDELPETVNAPIAPPPQGAVQSFVDATKADIRFGGNKACYVPSLDFVSMPATEQFASLDHFHATELHELVHWSGAKSRLDRDLSGRFRTRAYAAEELIAEFGAAFLCAHLGVTGRLRHADYIANWLELLRHDDRAVFTAASRASQAADYLRAFREYKEAVSC